MYVSIAVADAVTVDVTGDGGEVKAAGTAVDAASIVQRSAGERAGSVGHDGGSNARYTSMSMTPKHHTHTLARRRARKRQYRSSIDILCIMYPRTYTIVAV